jgi:hypothetical protein
MFTRLSGVMWQQKIIISEIKDRSRSDQKTEKRILITVSVFFYWIPIKVRVIMLRDHDFKFEYTQTFHSTLDIHTPSWCLDDGRQSLGRYHGRLSYSIERS